MTVALIVTTYNWVQALELSLKSALTQTQLPDEIIIADDGSTSDTKELIEKISRETNVKIIHSWQEDDGFRLAKSRNLAISKSSSNYIIVIDGDMILDKNFILDHLSCAKKGFYLQGSRVLLTDNLSKEIFRKKDFIKPSLFSKNVINKKNMLYLPLLTKLICSQMSTKLRRIRGCNFSLFKEDILKVNGFNEAFNKWGREDSEFVQRLYNQGIERKNLKFAGIQYHLYHKEGNSNSFNDDILQRAIDEKLTWCENGIDKHLKKL